MNDFNFIYLEDILELHDAIILKFGGRSGIRDAKILESDIQRPINVHLYVPGSTIFNLAAYLIHGIILGHPFFDGNKRTAMSAGLLLLKENKCYRSNLDSKILENLALKICTHESSEEETAACLEKLFNRVR